MFGIIDSKTVLSDAEKNEVIGKLISPKTKPDERKKDFYKSLDKIKIAHRNTKLFLFMMSGPFLLLLLGFKYAFKLFVLYFIFKKVH